MKKKSPPISPLSLSLSLKVDSLEYEQEVAVNWSFVLFLECPLKT